MNNGLYIHVPFCRRKCAYCDFYSLSGKEDRLEEYTRAVIRNIPADIIFDTVYFGGGTPSLLSGEQVKNILSAANTAKNAEITAECNPDSADLKKLVSFREAGVNRISFGVQSFDEKELSALGRLHDPKGAKKAIISAKEAGFENISADLMLGVPYQDEKSVLENIDILSEIGVTHISAYMLKIEEGTPLALDSGLISRCADEDSLADIYLSASERLEALGFEQYEISNFAKRGFECRHNLKYWHCEDYLGIGPSAHSCMNSSRFAVKSDLDLFLSQAKQPTYITDDSPCGVEEKMMLALRLREGFDLSQTEESRAKIEKKALLLEKQGLVTLNKSRICLTKKGFLVSNEIITLLSEEL